MIPSPFFRTCAALAILAAALSFAPVVAAAPPDCSDFRMEDIGSIASICVDLNARPQDIIESCWALTPDPELPQIQRP